MKVDSNKLKWAWRGNLEGLFNLQCITPREDLLRDFLWTQGATKHGRIQGWVRGQEILIDHILIHEQFGISKEGTIDVASATFDEAKTTLKKITSPHAFVENENWSVIHMKEEFHARLVVIFVIFLPKRVVRIF
jgi:hypothetical protein